MSLLVVDDLRAGHGLLEAVRGISLAVDEGRTLALVGANGAGKTTLLRSIAGAHPAKVGRIVLDGVDVTKLKVHQRVQRGLALVPEGRRIFPQLTVRENLLVAGKRARRGDWNLDTVLDAFPMLRGVLDHKGSELSGGQQQATAIGRAMMTNPRVLLIDELSLGLAPVAVDAVYQSVSSLLTGGATVVLVEQDLERAMSVSHRMLCMLEGRVVLEGDTSGLTREQVTAAYFGVPDHVRAAGSDRATTEPGGDAESPDPMTPGRPKELP
ncbi:MAG TPA: ABC transporter ATP-binding protein [Propionibacteriaceae bacterium]|nr:ABC transporter ATP-binding protein [Propionibacteriaceae bacterium]